MISSLLTLIDKKCWLTSTLSSLTQPNVLTVVRGLLPSNKIHWRLGYRGGTWSARSTRTFPQ